MSKHMYSTANLSDKELKEQGNRMFSARKYEEAINCYSKAIVSQISWTEVIVEQSLTQTWISCLEIIFR